VKAAILTKLNAPLELWDVEPDQPLRYGQVLVEMICSGICGAQLQEIRGEKGDASHLPHLLGHEGCGIVVTTGLGVSRVRKGQKVVLHWRKAAGIASGLPTYDSTKGKVGSGAVATLAQQCIASENRLTPVPDDTPQELAALLGCGLSTALGTVEREAELKIGQTVLIVGCGGLGMNLIRACRIAGAGHIACCDIHPGKEAVALALGAHEYINSSPDKLPMANPWINSWTGSSCGMWRDGREPRHQFDVIIETSGSPQAISDSLTQLAPSGRFIMVGHPPSNYLAFLHNADHMFEGEGKTIKATQGGGFKPDRDIPRYIAAWRAGVLNVDGIVTHRLPLEKVNEAVALVQAGEAGRVMIYMDK
jgi:S-(hydroxymethyl)glutathione dehydrogenase/alcohol dehydrogenase